MPRKVNIAAIQMDATPAPTPERLVRAERLATQASEQGAQLVVLPELFNTGYVYSDRNFQRVETLDGPTPTWMRATADRLGIHLAGTLMLLDQDEVFNALLLFAPNGRLWRYDKNYPWGWERGYFRDSHRITVAHTDLGDLGLLICWDAGHQELWKRYAGQVDLMLICSCPPNIPNATYTFSNGELATFADMGPITRSLKDSANKVFDEAISQQTTWLGVPSVNSCGCGHFRSRIPNGKLWTLLISSGAPWLIRHLPYADDLEISSDYVQANKIWDASGQVLAESTQESGEGLAISAVSLADMRPSPQEPQPTLPVPMLSYLFSDWLLPWLSIPAYRAGLRRTWGERMAPVQASTRRWMAVLLLGVGIGYLYGRLYKRR